eukprot:CAMPEP_0172722296 /NCGR_PEP_ID=MMETSP1074-20121228/81140_1 /TAXON_ID=2916 /ORGANISM="Ceratium fusus, Strain PA161109" /LENGTH=105 /DNA_ID=CAMNT_0013548261 /DNA_START=370 /DNA_END=684 /DNA_ORIENTATION=+
MALETEAARASWGNNFEMETEAARASWGNNFENQRIVGMSTTFSVEVNADETQIATLAAASAAETGTWTVSFSSSADIWALGILGSKVRPSPTACPLFLLPPLRH